MSRPLIRFFAAALVAVSGLALTAVTFDAEAARVGKGGNAGRQSSNVTNQNTAQPSSATSTTTQRAATAPAAAGAATAGAAAKTGASKWLRPSGRYRRRSGYCGLAVTLRLRRRPCRFPSVGSDRRCCGLWRDVRFAQNARSSTRCRGCRHGGRKRDRPAKWHVARKQRACVASSGRFATIGDRVHVSSWFWIRCACTRSKLVYSC